MGPQPPQLVADFVSLMLFGLAARQWRLDSTSPLADLRADEAEEAEAKAQEEEAAKAKRRRDPSAHRRMILLRDVTVVLSRWLKRAVAKRRHAKVCLGPCIYAWLSRSLC